MRGVIENRCQTLTISEPSKLTILIKLDKTTEAEKTTVPWDICSKLRNEATFCTMHILYIRCVCEENKQL